MGLDHAAAAPAATAGGATARTKIHGAGEDGAAAVDCAAAEEEEEEDCATTSMPLPARKPEPVAPVDPADVLFPHERSPDAAGQKRSMGAALGEDAHGGLTDRPCEKKLRRDERFHVQDVVDAESTVTSTSARRPRRQDRVLSPLAVADAEQIRQHLRDVRREVFLRPMIAIVTRLMFHKYNHGLFNVRVDPVEWKIPHYFEIVKSPMDLTLVKTKCLNLEYATAEECAADIKLVFSNACLFNPPGHVVHECATLLAKEFDLEYARYESKRVIQEKRREEHSCPSCLANVCNICDEKCINFEPPLVICSGPCKQRIKRHSVYYKTQDQLHYWCAKCYSTLPKTVVLKNTVVAGEEGEVKLAKQQLVKAKFVDELTEPWVQCDKCNGWVHQICALFNACENPEEDEEAAYSCPLCRLEDLESEGWTELAAVPSETSVDEFPIKFRRDVLASIGSHSPVVKRKPHTKDFTRALGFDGDVRRQVFEGLPGDGSVIFEPEDDMPQTGCRGSSSLKSSHLSVFMQNWVRQALVNAGELEVAESIVIKVASSIKSSCCVSRVVREQFRSSTQQYPETIDYFSKSIFVFQKIDGVEVCIFSMYVQEYDETAAVIANRNRTYIAYIDSLVYMRPRHIRTSLFHEILISYLGFCKGKGFEYAHIWACPTTRGGDFIYWCHPSFQKNPGKDRLLQWYMAMADKAKKAGVAYSCEDLYATNFEHLEARLQTELPPYFDGDYWPSEVDRLYANPPKRGKLSKEVYEENLRGERFRKRLIESVKSSRESLFVIGLQPKCSSCQSLIVNSSCWISHDGHSYVCDTCYSSHGDSIVAVEEKMEPPSFLKSFQAPDEMEISCPFLEYRANMLKNCEESHYQFDSFRRAKYSTMMIIYHATTTQEVRPLV